MIAEEYLGRSRLFRRLKSGSLRQLVELYTARLVRDELAGHGTWRCLNLVSDLISWIKRCGLRLAISMSAWPNGTFKYRAGKQCIQPGGAEAVAIGIARGGHDRAGGAAADLAAGLDIRGVRRVSAKGTRVGAENHHSPPAHSFAASCARCALPSLQRLGVNVTVKPHATAAKFDLGYSGPSLGREAITMVAVRTSVPARPPKRSQQE
ncbi:hypothetical protein [Bradyrhizobium sp. CSA112]|uniref:hypothetical protein n=1 Tax=Bradyrhizobium sp. CSA112 TaxID=2699170 RepID=UPI0023B091FF|nr:hypothetical protein [Bradyrhizobium sp. CSA112]